MTSSVITGAIGLLLGVVVILVWPLLKGRGGAGVERQAVNLGVLRAQRDELERDRESGRLDAQAYSKAMEELERRALEDVGQAPSTAAATVRGIGARPRLALGIGLGLPAVVVAMYMALGEPTVITGAKPATDNGSHALSPEQIQGMVERLSEKLQSNPNDGPGWLMLARSYSVLGRYPESVAAYGRAAGLMPPDGQMLADFADTVAMAQGKKLQGEPERLVRQALDVDPKNLKALALLGTAYFERQDYKAAIGEWQKVLALVPPESNVAAGIQGSVRDAENRLARAGGAPEGVAKSATEAASAASVSGIVAIEPSLSGRFAPGDTVFVFARAEQGPRMPLAIIRKTVADLPFHFTLDDSLAMSPNFRLSQQARVVVGARISKTGDALPRPGDWQGLAEPTAPGTKGVKIVINAMIN